jgi:hypothetical protein
MAQAPESTPDDDAAPERRRSEPSGYADRALKVAQVTATVTTGVILLATGGAFFGSMMVTRNPKAAILAAGKVLNFTTKHYKTIAGSAAIVSGSLTGREG